MGRLAKKSLSMLLAVLIIFSMASLCCLNAAADNSVTDGEVNVYYRVYDGTSDYGLASYHWEDKDGNTVNFNEHAVMMFASRNALPTYYSSVDEGYVTPIENQGSTSLCWAYSALSTIGSYGLKTGIAADFDEADFSEAHLGWFSGTASNDINNPLYGEINADVSSGGPYETGGDWKQAGVYLAAGIGLAPEDSYKSATTSPAIDEAYRYDHSAGILTSMEKICETGNISTVKSSIMNYGAVKASYYNTITNMYASNDEYNADTYAYYKAVNDGVPTNHAISIVGWDDDFSKENFINQPEGDGAWLVKNSWGRYFGDKGYFWISYYDATLSSFIRFTYADGNKYDNIYQYSGDDSDITLAKEGHSSVEQATVFKSKGNEILKAVSFFTLQDSITYTVEIYRNLPDDFTSPTDGTLAASFLSSAAYEGYHTAELNEEIKLDTDETFAVVIRFSAYGDVYLPANTGNKYYTDNSYINFNVSAPDWKNTDYYTESANTNLCIKAFTSDIPEATGENARTYTVNYHTEDLNGNYVLTSETRTGYSGETAKVSTQVEKGLAVDTERSTLSGIIADDNSLVLDVYIDRLSFDLTFICEDKTQTLTFPYEATIEIPDFSKTGYKVEWQGGIPETMPGTDLTVTGKYVSETYKIYWKLNGVTLFTHSYEFGEKINIPENPIHSYGTFIGWDTVIPVTMPAKNLVINALFSWKKYTVTWVWNGGTRIDTVEYGSPLTPPEVPDSDDGKVFRNWDTAIPDSMPARNLTFNAVYGTKLFTAYYYIDGVQAGTSRFSLETDKSTLISDEYAPQRNGYEIIWDEFEIEANDIIINGTCVPIEYSVSFVADGETLSVQYFTVETMDSVEIVEPVAPPKAGFVNARWNDYELSLSNITVTPKYDIPTVTTANRKTVNLGSKFNIVASCNFERISKTYATNNRTVAVVDNNGNINAVGIGECIITVTCTGYDEVGNEITVKSTVHVVVKEKFEPKDFSELFRQLFENFFKTTLHDIAYNLKNIIMILLSVA